MIRQMDVRANADLLIEALFALDEPWQSRFLCYLAERVTGDNWDGDRPRREEVAVWLGNKRLEREIRMMLNSWKGIGSRDA